MPDWQSSPLALSAIAADSSNCNRLATPDTERSACAATTPAFEQMAPSVPVAEDGVSPDPQNKAQKARNKADEETRNRKKQSGGPAFCAGAILTYRTPTNVYLAIYSVRFDWLAFNNQPPVSPQSDYWPHSNVLSVRSRFASLCSPDFLFHR
jgi:hypothetical protein